MEGGVVNADYLRDLAERLMAVPAMYGTDQGDVDRLLEIAKELDGVLPNE
jgi:hypothetical protein